MPFDNVYGDQHVGRDTQSSVPIGAQSGEPPEDIFVKEEEQLIDSMLQQGASDEDIREALAGLRQGMRQRYKEMMEQPQQQASAMPFDSAYGDQHAGRDTQSSVPLGANLARSPQNQGSATAMPPPVFSAPAGMATARGNPGEAPWGQSVPSQQQQQQQRRERCSASLKAPWDQSPQKSARGRRAAGRNASKNSASVPWAVDNAGGFEQPRSTYSAPGGRRAGQQRPASVAGSQAWMAASAESNAIAAKSRARNNGSRGLW